MGRYYLDRALLLKMKMPPHPDFLEESLEDAGCTKWFPDYQYGVLYYCATQPRDYVGWGIKWKELKQITIRKEKKNETRSRNKNKTI